MRNRISVTCLVLLSSMGVFSQGAIAQLGTPQILQLELTNLVNYNNDIADGTKAATSAAITPSAPQNTLQDGTGLGDIVAVNGQPVKGTYIIRYTRLNTGPTVTTGQSIADVTRNALIFVWYEIQGLDGVAIGTITAQGFSRGTPPPGAPASQTAANLVITGGTGAFVGVRGFAGSTNPTVSVANRMASFVEDPAYRRINGGGTGANILTLYPAERPQIVAISHADFSPVSAANPAKAGEILVMVATGLGPTRPGVDPGQAFPASPLATANSPVAVTINGTAAKLLAAVGYPKSTDGFQVNFEVPPGTAKGSAQVQVSAAWMAGPAVTINVQ